MTTNERYRQRLSDFRQAVTRLDEALNRPVIDDIIRDAIIQRFEFTYEQAWKTLKLWLELKDIDVRNPKDALQAALEQGLLDDGNLWTELHKNRNLTSHTYNEKIAVEVFEFVKIKGCAALLTLVDKLEQGGAP